MQFSDFKLLKVDFKVNQPEAGEKKPVNYNPEVLIKHQAVDDQKLLIVMIGLKVMESDMPFCFEVHGVGLFKFDQMPEPQLLEQFGRINCPAILYPYLRETVADLTRRAGFTPLHLKPINFIDLENRRKAAIDKPVATKKKATKKKSK